MTELRPKWWYAIVQWSPKPADGEYANVGIILYCQRQVAPAAHLAITSSFDRARIRFGDDHPDLGFLRQALDALPRQIVRAPEGEIASDGTGTFYDRLATILQRSRLARPVHLRLTEPRPAPEGAPEMVVERLFWDHVYARHVPPAPRAAMPKIETGLEALLVQRFVRPRMPMRPKYRVLFQVRSQAGFFSGGERSLDALAVPLWPSETDLHGFELKVSRGDWLRERKDPEKSEAFRKYLHRFWLVVSDRGIVKGDELPEGWGLLVARKKGSGLVAVKEAPALTPEPMPPGLLAGILKRAMGRQTHLASVIESDRLHAERERVSMLKSRLLHDYQTQSKFDARLHELEQEIIVARRQLQCLREGAPPPPMFPTSPSDGW